MQLTSESLWLPLLHIYYKAHQYYFITLVTFENPWPEFNEAFNSDSKSSEGNMIINSGDNSFWSVNNS